MKYYFWIWALILTIFSLAIVMTVQSEETKASLNCIDITPSVESGKITPDTVVESTLKYSIDLSRLKSEQFSITILFGSSERENQLFNKPETRLGKGHVFLDEPSGTIKLKYPMDAVWQDPRLKHPISIIFFLIKHDKDGAGQAIASAGPFIFRSGF